MSADRPDKSFLSRWARLKREAAKPPEPAPPEPVETPPPEDEAARAAKAAELEERLAALPKLEDIGPDTDVRVFLQDWVPHAIRNAALRRVWSSDPRIVDFKEVADYQWDWNVPGGAPGCGPLEPGFDAEAAVRRIFREGIPGEEHDRDRLSQGGEDTTQTSSKHAAVQHESAPEPAVLTSENYTKVVDEHANATTAPAAGLDAAQHDAPLVDQEPRPTRRRHGRALPDNCR